MTLLSSIFRKKNVVNVNPDGGWFLSDTENRYAGRHLLIDLFGVEPERLKGPNMILKALKNAIRDTKATVLHSHMHEFTGGGVTGVIALAESHVSIHTWPEEGIATIDVFMCGQCDPTKTILPIRSFFKPRLFKIQEFKRAMTPLLRS